MRVAAEGGFLENGILVNSIVQGGFVRSDDIHLDNIGECITPDGVKKKFAERGWHSSLWETDASTYDCRFYDDVLPGETVRVSVFSPSDKNWTVYFDGVTVNFNHNGFMRRASLLEAGGEWVAPDTPNPGCIGAGYGIGTGLRWQRAREVGIFASPYTIQSAPSDNKPRKWRVGDVPNGFWVRNRGCPNP